MKVAQATSAGQSRFDEAESIFQFSVDNARTYYGDDYSNIGGRFSEWARVRVRRGDLAGAESLMREALELYRNAPGDEHPRTQAARLALADVLVKRGCYAEAEPLLLDWFESAEHSTKDSGISKTQASSRRLLRFYRAWLAVAPGNDRRAAVESWRGRLVEVTQKNPPPPTAP